MTAARRPPQRRNDPVLLIEACLALLLLALFIALYVFPTQTGATRISWWTPVVLGGFALGLLLLDGWRRKRRHRREVQEMMEDHLGGPP
jgi:peptidoglycan/LPS O-acetylase OafA/YrhL